MLTRPTLQQPARQELARILAADAQGARDFDYGYRGPARLSIGGALCYALTKEEVRAYADAREGRSYG